MSMLYFDHSASSPPKAEVIRTVSEVMERIYANPSSLHQGGSEARKLLERAREQAGRLFGTDPSEWLFTSGGTESNNLAIFGVARRYRNRGRHLIVSSVEHPSVAEPFRALEREGFRVTVLPVGPTGHVDPADVEAALTDETILVSVMHVNNEVGSVQPIEAIGKLLKDRPRTLLHVDGVQSVGKLPAPIREWGVDLFTISAHKFGGPRGAGWLYVRGGVELEPLIRGGGQEDGLRSGTENVPAIVGAAKALRLAIESQPEREERMRRLRRRIVRGVAAMPGVVLSGPEEDDPRAPMAPHIVHFCCPGLKPEVIVHSLEELGVLVSTKSACSSKDDKPSAVLTAMGRDAACAASGIRVSLGDEHDEAAVDALLERLDAVLRKLMPLRREERH